MASQRIDDFANSTTVKLLQFLLVSIMVPIGFKINDRLNGMEKQQNDQTVLLAKHEGRLDYFDKLVPDREQRLRELEKSQNILVYRLDHGGLTGGAK